MVKLDPAALLDLEEGEPLEHSNPDIQVLLDRYSRLCEDQADDPAVSPSPVVGSSDRRSPSRAVFSNTNVDLSRIEVVGFDYDYTLATCECERSASLFVYDRWRAVVWGSVCCFAPSCVRSRRGRVPPFVSSMGVCSFGVPHPPGLVLHPSSFTHSVAHSEAKRVCFDDDADVRMVLPLSCSLGVVKTVTHKHTLGVWKQPAR